MSEQIQGIYEFHNFQLDIGKGLLFRDEQPITLQWKTFELLCILVKSNGKLITRDELMNELWAETFVEDNNLSQHIRALRKALVDGENGSVFIETIPRCGYRFLPEVKIIETLKATPIGEGQNQTTAEDVLTKPASMIVQPTTVSHVSDNGNKTKVPVLARSEDSAIIKLENAPSEIKQQIGVQPKITIRRRGLRRGVKALLWGLGIGFSFLILLQILKILSVTFFATPNNLSKELLEMLGTLISILSIPVLFGWFVGIGLCLFGIVRIIFALFEKENSKLRSSLIEKLIAAIIIVIIAAIVIPNLIASYRSAQEFQQ